MISRLRGQVVEIRGQSFIVDVNGVGYEVLGTSSCLTSVTEGATATLVIFMDVKEDSIRLFGFGSQLEKQVFLLLMKVKGVGTKTSMHIVSRIDSRELLKLIGSADLSRLSAIKGIGRKTAERIVVELKERVGDYIVDAMYGEPEISPSGSALSEARAALRALGFSQSDSERALAAAEKSLLNMNSDSGTYVREALRHV